MFGLNDGDDVLFFEELNENVYVSVRYIKDFYFVIVYVFSIIIFKVIFFGYVLVIFYDLFILMWF